MLFYAATARIIISVRQATDSPSQGDPIMYDPNDYAGEKLEQDLQYEERRALAEEEAERDEATEREDLFYREMAEKAIESARQITYDDIRIRGLERHLMNFATWLDQERNRERTRLSQRIGQALSPEKTGAGPADRVRRAA